LFSDIQNTTYDIRATRYDIRDTQYDIRTIMQNKPNLLNAQMNVTSVVTMNYEQITTNNANKNKANLCHRYQTQPVVSLSNLFQTGPAISINNSSQHLPQKLYGGAVDSTILFRCAGILKIVWLNSFQPYNFLYISRSISSACLPHRPSARHLATRGIWPCRSSSWVSFNPLQAG
jgi:hypothetical protein